MGSVSSKKGRMGKGKKRQANIEALFESGRRDLNENKVALDAQAITRYLEEVAAYLNQRGQSLEIALIGGAVNTVQLRTRSTTTDVDYMAAALNKDQRTVLARAIEDVARRHNLGPQWMNNHAQAFYKGNAPEEMINAARQQGSIVIRRPGLTAYAVPWKYAIAAKFGRLTGGSAPDHDMPDVVAYLREHINANGKIPRNDIRRWGEEYKQAWVKDSNTLTMTVNKLDQEYQREYGESAFSDRK